MNCDLDKLTGLVVDDLPNILEKLGVLEITEYNDRISFACPIHDSDNEESLSVFTDGHSSVGNWRCWTNECQNELVTDKVKGEEVVRPRGNNIFGLIRSLMGVEMDRHVQYWEAIEWCKKQVGYEDDDTPDEIGKLTEKKKFVRNMNILTRSRQKIDSIITRDEIRTKLRIPAKYFLERGFQSDTLDKYDVGFCSLKGKQMYNRVVVPVYDDEYKHMIGCVGRTIQPKCNKCGKYHYKDRHCPQTKLEKLWANKWINSKGFKAESFLYNYWFAKDKIASEGTAILVEGQGDVWRLEESGIHIGLGLFGDSLTDDQMMILDGSGAMNLIILTDSDDAGLKARERIKTKCQRSYNCVFVDLPEKDIGEMAAEEVKELLKGYL